jgi:hypothetical protein
MNTLHDAIGTQCFVHNWVLIDKDNNAPEHAGVVSIGRKNITPPNAPMHKTILTPRFVKIMYDESC